MSHPNILVENKDGIVTIEISRREKKNAITSDMYRAMSAALSRARDDSHVRVVLLRGLQPCQALVRPVMGERQHSRAHGPLGGGLARFLQQAAPALQRNVGLPGPLGQLRQNFQGGRGAGVLLQVV